MNCYRLGVCEDDAKERQLLKTMCQEILDVHQIPCTISAFDNAARLEAASYQWDFDLLLLDIQMEGMSGMELAKKLYARGNSPRLLFVTGAPEYALEGYQVHPIHFLVKPVERSQLEAVLLQDWNSHHRPKNVVLRSGGKTTSLAVDDILYLENLNRTVIAHTTQGDYTFPISLSEAEQSVPPGCFARCHNSFLVNLSKVTEISRKGVLLRDGTCLAVGRRYYQEFQTAHIRYVNR